MSEKSKEIGAQFAQAVERLTESLVLPKNDVVRDSAIKRFEIAFDLAWKSLKAFLEDQGIACASPRACFREAFRQNLIVDETIWLEMIEMRNETAHTYNVATAERIFNDLPAVLKSFRDLSFRLGR